MNETCKTTLDAVYTGFMQLTGRSINPNDIA